MNLSLNEFSKIRREYMLKTYPNLRNFFFKTKFLKKLKNEVTTKCSKAENRTWENLFGKKK